MDSIVFRIQGSAAEPYTTEFRKNGNNLSAWCTCPAGALGQHCKHRLRILSGDTEGIVSGNEQEVVKVVDWLAGTDVAAALVELNDAELRFEVAKRNVSFAKKKLARSLGN